MLFMTRPPIPTDLTLLISTPRDVSRHVSRMNRMKSSPWALMNLVMAPRWHLEAVPPPFIISPLFARLGCKLGSRTGTNPSPQQWSPWNPWWTGTLDAAWNPTSSKYVICDSHLLIVAESTRRRVSWWFVIQTGLLGTVVFFQIWYMKRFFETRRVM